MNWEKIKNNLNKIDIPKGLSKLEKQILINMKNETNKEPVEPIDYTPELNDLMHLENYPETLSNMKIEHNNWVQPDPELEVEREVSTNNMNYEKVKKEKLKELKDAVDIESIEVSDQSHLLGSWKYFSKYFNMSLKELINKEPFSTHYNAIINNDSIPMIYARRTRNGIKFDGGGHRMLLTYKLRMTIKAIIIDQS